MIQISLCANTLKHVTLSDNLCTFLLRKIEQHEIQNKSHFEIKIRYLCFGVPSMKIESDEKEQ